MLRCQCACMSAVVPDGFQGQIPGLRPAMRRVPRMCIANNSFRPYVVKRLQVCRHLFEHREAAWTVHFTDMRRYDDAVVEAQRDGPFHLAADGQHRLLLLPRQAKFAGRTAPPDAYGAHRPGNSAKDRIVGRPDDRPIVIQERIGYAAKPACRFLIVSEYGLATDISRACNEW